MMSLGNIFRKCAVGHKFTQSRGNINHLMYMDNIKLFAFSYIFRKCTGSYKFTNSQDKINHLMYMEDIKIFAKDEKKEQETQIQTIRIYSQDIGMEFGIKKGVMLIMK